MKLLFVPILLFTFISLSYSYTYSIYDFKGDQTLDNLPDLSALDTLLKPLDAIHAAEEKLGLRKSRERVPGENYKLDKTDCFCSEKGAEKSSNASKVIVLFLSEPKCEAFVINNLFLLTKASCVDENQSNLQFALDVSEQERYDVNYIYVSGRLAFQMCELHTDGIAILELAEELPLSKGKIEPTCLDSGVAKKSYEKSKKWIKKIVGDNYCVEKEHKFHLFG